MNEQPRLEIEADRDGDDVIVRLKGEVDLRSSPDLRRRLTELVEPQAPKLVIMDLSGVDYVDSSGVGTIVELKRRALRTGGDVVLVGLQPRVRSVFEITRLDKFFKIAKSIDEARQA